MSSRGTVANEGVVDAEFTIHARTLQQATGRRAAIRLACNDFQDEQESEMQFACPEPDFGVVLASIATVRVIHQLKHSLKRRHQACHDLFFNMCFNRNRRRHPCNGLLE
eukprot:CAMPEP_0115238704 /NCGR_PEP_ID=MMETSP0270-20121206/37021_1 /TAXON_ID=71861 /ORGANISM="Scrippsiella trochoidea, Strain CCMP3099" /LENGTH=108 /DNA_ID=CAMNT_0002653641 /DNA_START=824 /DNA_END=1150 /DNA_ORIENTATION=-